MATVFDAAMAAVCATLDGIFGEGFILQPQAFPETSSGRFDVNADRVASQARPTIPFVGDFIAPGALQHAHGRRMADSATHAIMSDKPVIDVAEDAIAPSAQSGDLVYRNATGEVFELAAQRPGDLGRVWLYLNAKDRLPEAPR